METQKFLALRVIIHEAKFDPTREQYDCVWNKPPYERGIIVVL